jgi:hypothetical protein
MSLSLQAGVRRRGAAGPGGGDGRRDLALGQRVVPERAARVLQHRVGRPAQVERGEATIAHQVGHGGLGGRVVTAQEEHVRLGAVVTVGQHLRLQRVVGAHPARRREALFERAQRQAGRPVAGEGVGRVDERLARQAAGRGQHLHHDTRGQGHQHHLAEGDRLGHGASRGSGADPGDQGRELVRVGRGETDALAGLRPQQADRATDASGAQDADVHGELRGRWAARQPPATRPRCRPLGRLSTSAAHRACPSTTYR